MSWYTIIVIIITFKLYNLRVWLTLWYFRLNTEKFLLFQIKRKYVYVIWRKLCAFSFYTLSHVGVHLHMGIAPFLPVSGKQNAAVTKIFFNNRTATNMSDSYTNFMFLTLTLFSAFHKHQRFNLVSEGFFSTSFFGLKTLKWIKIWIKQSLKLFQSMWYILCIVTNMLPNNHNRTFSKWCVWLPLSRCQWN